MGVCGRALRVAAGTPRPALRSLEVDPLRLRNRRLARNVPATTDTSFQGCSTTSRRGRRGRARYRVRDCGEGACRRHSEVDRPRGRSLAAGEGRPDADGGHQQNSLHPRLGSRLQPQAPDGILDSAVGRAEEESNKVLRKLLDPLASV